jgi:hypothetical protein
MKYAKYVIPIPVSLFFFALYFIILRQSQQWIGKGIFLVYEAIDRSHLQTEDNILYALIPSQASDIRIWKFRLSGYWGGRYRIDKSLLKAWVKENNIPQRLHHTTLMITYDNEGNNHAIDTSKGVIYETIEWDDRWKNTKMTKKRFLLYFEDTEGVAYFTFIMH